MRKLIFFAVITFGLAASSLEKIHFKVEKKILKNGLRVLVVPDSSAPIISFQQWFDIGSKDEKPGRTGMAHFFEHFMFKGTNKYSGKKLEKILQRNGISNNAFTTRDYTGYYENLPSDKLELVIDIESDRMVNLNFSMSDVKSEREVVKEERRMRVDNSISGLMWQNLFKTVYKVHPYKTPVIGYMADLNAAGLPDMKSFYQKYYAPNNAVLVISGDVDPKKAFKLVDKYYAKIPARVVEKSTLQKEPTQKGTRNSTLRKDVQNATVMIAFKGPKSGTDDAFALDLLSNILGSGNSSRLYKRVVYKEQIASSISSYSYTPKHEGIFFVQADVKPKQSELEVKRSIYSELFKLRNRLISKKELEKAKNQVKMDYVDSLKTASGKARIVALNEIYFSDYKEFFKDLNRYNSVTREQVKLVANKYLKANMRSTIQVLPKKKGE